MEKRLKVMMVVSLAGMLLLLLLSSLVYPRAITDISDITSKSIGSHVNVAGKIAGIKGYNNKTFFVLLVKDSTGNITAVANADYDLEKDILKNETYIFSGKVQEYNSTLQINLNKIEIYRKKL